jgi:hypothetical protein
METKFMEREISNQSTMQYCTAAADKGLCPFVQKPDAECYCSEMQSQSPETMIYYVNICGGDFKDCEIYKRLNKNETP